MFNVQYSVRDHEFSRNNPKRRDFCVLARAKLGDAVRDATIRNVEVFVFVCCGQNSATQFATQMEVLVVMMVLIVGGMFAGILLEDWCRWRAQRQATCSDKRTI